MTDFAYKAKHWPRISTLAELLARLDVVRPKAWEGYSYTANPPCHESDSKASLSVGESERGGLLVKCWGGCDLDRIEESLGVALQIRYHDGNLRYREAGAPRPAAAPPPKPPPSREPIYDVRPFGLSDVRAAKIWLAVKQGKPPKPWTGTIGGVTYGFRQSLANLELARHGGEYVDSKDVRMTLLPHDSYVKVQGIIRRIEDKTGARCVPAISLAASEAVRYPFPLAVVDCDYRPADDQDGSGAAYRSGLYRRAVRCGLPVYGSSGGNGFHILARAHWGPNQGYKADKNGNRTAYRQERWKPPGTQGIAVDVFLPGGRHSLTLRLDKALSEPDGDLPLLSMEELNDLMLAGPDDVAGDAEQIDRWLEDASLQAAAAFANGDEGLIEYCGHLLDFAEEEGPSPAQQERITRGRAILARFPGSG